MTEKAERTIEKKWLNKAANLALGVFFVFLFFLINATPADAGNQQITFQGKLTNASGNTVSDGTYYLKLTIYDAASGGTCQYTASSTCSAVTSTAVTVTNGIFSINLGDTSASLAAISPTLFNSSELYLGITVCSGAGTGCDSEMTPRKRLTASPYAFNADYLSGLATSTIGGAGSYVPVTDSSGNLKITNSLLIATTTAGQFGVGTTTVPSGVKSYVEGTTASNKLLVLRGAGSQSGNLQEWQNSAGTALALIDSSGNFSASGTLATFGNATVGGHLYPSSDNLYDLGASSTQWRYGNFQGGLLVANSINTSTLSHNSLIIGQRINTYGVGYFYVDSSGNVSASGTLAAFGNTTLSGSLSVTSNTSSLRSLYLSSLTAAPNVAAGTLYFNSADAKFYGYTANGTAVDLGTSGVNDWGRFSSTYGALAMMTSSTYPVWFDGAVYASSTLTVSGSTNASSSALTGTTFVIGKGNSWGNGVFSVDANGGVSVSSTLNVAGGPDPVGSVWHPTHKSALTDAASYNLKGARSVFVSGNYAYIAAWTEDALTIVDVSNPASTTYKGSYSNATLLDGAKSVFVSGNYAYVIGETADTLAVIDISNPINPTLKGSITDSVNLGTANSVFVSGNYAYVASDYSTTGILSIVDVSNPANPVLVSSLTDGTNLDGAESVFVSGKYAYVAAHDSNILGIVDISNPRQPMVVGSLTDSAGTSFAAPNSVFVSGNYAYLVGITDDALEIIDISNPANPVHKGSLTNGTGGALLNDPISIFVSGNYAYVGADSSSALEIIDISNPANPVHKGSIVNGDGGARLLSVYSIFVSGNYVYVAEYASGTSGSLEIIDISGAIISNAQIGALRVDTLQINSFAQFDQHLAVRGGLNVGGSAQLFGDVSIGGGRATSTNMGGGGITIFTNQASSTFTSRVLDVSGNSGFVFNAGTSTWTGSDRTLVSFQTGGTDKFLFAADGSVIFNKAASYNSGYFNIGSTGNTSVSGTLQVFGGASTGGLKVSASNTTTTLTSLASGAGAGAFVFDTNTTLNHASSSVLFSVRNNGSKVFSIDATGYVTATGTIQANNTSPGPGDVAEYVNLVPGETAEAGDVLIVDENGLNQYRKSDTMNARNVAGVISGTGAFLIGASGANRAPLALVGLVKVKVTDENGPIQVGDYLVTASKPGYAMKYDTALGQSAGLVGMALQSFAQDEGKILILINKGLVNGTSGNSAVLNVSANEGGQLTNNVDLDMIGQSILNLSAIKGKDDKWTINEDGFLIVKVKTKQGEKELYGLQSGQDKELVLSGSAQLENGVQKIEFSLLNQEVIDPDASIKVSVTLTGEAKGVFVSEKNYQGFTVKELGGGTSNATFDWLVIAKRRSVDYQESESAPAETSAPVAPETTSSTFIIETSPTPAFVLTETPANSAESVSSSVEVSSSTPVVSPTE
ncbi:MAG: hypothetical protein AAB849_02435 [Patescibacteria group bacterium]